MDTDTKRQLLGQLFRRRYACGCTHVFSRIYVLSGERRTKLIESMGIRCIDCWDKYD